MRRFWHTDLYDVLVRRKEHEAWQPIGAVHAPTPELAAVYAARTYDEETWAAMQVVPRASTSANEANEAFAGETAPVPQGGA